MLSEPVQLTEPDGQVQLVMITQLVRKYCRATITPTCNVEKSRSVRSRLVPPRILSRGTNTSRTWQTGLTSEPDFSGDCNQIVIRSISSSDTPSPLLS